MLGKALAGLSCRTVVVSIRTNAVREEVRWLCFLRASITSGGIHRAKQPFPHSVTDRSRRNYAWILVVLAMLLVASATAQQTPFPFMVNTWGYFAGAASGTPVGIGNWPNGEGSLTVTGTQGSNTLTVNTVNVGVIGDYQIDPVGIRQDGRSSCPEMMGYIVSIRSTPLTLRPRYCRFTLRWLHQ